MEVWKRRPSAPPQSAGRPSCTRRSPHSLRTGQGGGPSRAAPIGMARGSPWPVLGRRTLNGNVLCSHVLSGHVCPNSGYVLRSTLSRVASLMRAPQAVPWTPALWARLLPPASDPAHGRPPQPRLSPLSPRVTARAVGLGWESGPPDGTHAVLSVSRLGGWSFGVRVPGPVQDANSSTSEPETLAKVMVFLCGVLLDGALGKLITRSTHVRSEE